MTNEWALRDDILAATHHWQRIMAFCLLGALAGWLVSLLWPSPSRATQELYVGLNVYQAATDRNAAEQAGMVFSNVNDYKNWQMASLNSIIYTDSIIDETLERLSAGDPYWEGVNRGGLAAMLHVYWRNAGKWRLVAEHPDGLRAVQAVTAWQEVVVARVNAAIQEARNAALLDRQFQVVATQQAQSTARLAALIQVRNELSAWAQRITISTPASSLPTTERQALAQLLSLLTDLHDSTTWLSLSQTFPLPGSPSEAYLAWIQQTVPLVEQEIRVIQAQEKAAEQEKQSLATRYDQATENSQGLSAELKVDRISDAQTERSTVRPTGTLILIGATLGLIAWLLVWLVQANARTRQGTA